MGFHDTPTLPNRTKYGYDTDNNRVSMSDAAGITSLTNPTGETYSFTLDASNRLTNISRPGSQTQIAFDNANFVTQILHSSGTGLTICAPSFFSPAC